MFWPSWVSKPPMETKKTCRLAPIALRAPITRATVCSCCARPLFALLPVDGWMYCVGAATVEASKAVWKVACAAIERLTIDEYSLANRCWLSAVMIERSVVAAVVELNSVPLMPPICGRAVAADLVLERRLAGREHRVAGRPRCW